MTLKIDSIGKTVDLDKLAEAVKPSPAMETAALRASEAIRSIGDIAKRENSALARAAAALSVPVGMENVFKGLAEQQSLLADLARSPIPEAFVPTPMPLPDIQLPKNPIHETNEHLFETNKRLGKIETRFSKMEEIALKGAEIATGLQAYAAQFLQKFEIAATETDQSARRAVRIGIVAIVIAVAVPAAQTAIELFWDRPSEVSELAKAIDRLNATVVDMRASPQSDKVAEDNMLRRVIPPRPIIEPIPYTP